VGARLFLQRARNSDSSVVGVARSTSSASYIQSLGSYVCAALETCPICLPYFFVEFSGVSGGKKNLIFFSFVRADFKLMLEPGGQTA